MFDADLVIKLKAEIDVEHLRIKVKRVRKPQKGDVLITVHGGEEKAAVFKRRLPTQTYK